MEMLRGAHQFVTHLRRANNVYGFGSMVVQRSEQNLFPTKQREKVAHVLCRHFATGLGGGSGVEVKKKKIEGVEEDLKVVKKKVEGVEAERNEVKKKIEKIEAMSWDELSVAKQKALRDEVEFEKWKMAETNKLQDKENKLQDEKNKLQDILKGLQEKENILLKQTGPVANVERPSFFVAKDDKDRNLMDQAWEIYLEGKPKVEEVAQEWLQAITSAKVVRHPDVELKVNRAPHGLNDEQKATAELCFHAMENEWPASKQGEIGITKVTWDEKPLTDKDREMLATCMYVVTLPKAIPFEWLGALVSKDIKTNVFVGADLLFFRNVDIELMKQWNKHHRTVLGGNQGISKSWHLFKYLVCLHNSRLWQALCPSVPGTATPTLLEAKVVVYMCAPLTWTTLFLEENVAHSGSSDAVLRALHRAHSTSNALLLYDPGNSKESIPFSQQFAFRCLAACSPDGSRYEAFLKQEMQSVKYMPCVSLNEALAIGLRLLAAGSFESRWTQDELVTTLTSRYFAFGPYLRTLFLTEDNYSLAVLTRRKDLELLGAEKLKNLYLRTAILGETAADIPSHRLAQIHTPRAKDGRFTMVDNIILPAAETFLQEIESYISTLGLDELVKALNAEVTFKTWALSDAVPRSSALAFERLLPMYLCSETGLLSPHYATLFNKEDVQSDPIKLDGTSTFSTRQKEKSLNLDVKDMKAKILYIPDEEEAKLEFADMVWVEEDGGRNGDSPHRVVYAIQCTLAASHGKPISTYNKLRKRLGLESGDKLVVIFAVPAKHFEQYKKGNKSTYFTNLPEKELKKLKSIGELEFWVLQMHPHFLNKPSET